METVKKIWPWACAALSGVFLFLCFPPFDSVISPPPTNWLAWVSLTPLISAIWFSKRWNKREGLRIFLLGYVTGLVFFLSTLFWITTVTLEGWVPLCAYLALYPALWAVFVACCGTPVQKPEMEKPIWLSSLNNLRIAVLCGAAWVGLEWLRGIVFSGFGWNSLGVTLHKNIPLIQIAQFTGVGGLSFLIVMMNCILVATVKRLRMEVGRVRLRPHYDFGLTLALVVLVMLYGGRQIFKKAETLPLNVTAVQGNIPKNFNWDEAFEERILATYQRLTEPAAAFPSDLLLWPEAAPPRSIFSDEKNAEIVKALARKFDGDFLLGTLYFDGTGDYNSAALLTKKGEEAQIYNKMHLVPFGEYLPFRNSFPIFVPIVGSLVPGDFQEGIEPVVFQMEKKSVRIAPLICFEDTLGDLARQFTQRGAQLFVTLTNDGWFQESPESRQHLAQSVFRCAESGLPMVRSANTGITCIIDRYGRVIQTLQTEDGNTFIEGVMYGKVDVPTNPQQTFYTRYGEVFSMGCLGVTILVMAISLMRRRPSKGDSGSENS